MSLGETFVKMAVLNARKEKVIWNLGGDEINMPVCIIINMHFPPFFLLKMARGISREPDILCKQLFTMVESGVSF